MDTFGANYFVVGVFLKNRLLLNCSELHGKNALVHAEYSGSSGPEMASHDRSPEALNWHRSRSA